MPGATTPRQRSRRQNPRAAFRATGRRDHQLDPSQVSAIGATVQNGRIALRATKLVPVTNAPIPTPQNGQATEQHGPAAEKEVRCKALRPARILCHRDENWSQRQSTEADKDECPLLRRSAVAKVGCPERRQVLPAQKEDLVRRRLGGYHRGRTQLNAVARRTRRSRRQAHSRAERSESDNSAVDPPGPRAFA